jgi:hypothetical protein
MMHCTHLCGYMVTRDIYIYNNVLKYIYIIEEVGRNLLCNHGVTCANFGNFHILRPTTPSSINAKACFFARGAGAGAFSYVHTGRVKKPISSDPRAAFVAVASQVAA